MDRILRGIGFLRCIQADQSGSLNTVDFFTSHEGLLLCYEEGMTRQDSSTSTYYNLGCHFLWIGDRTRDIDGAHVEYFRGIANPIGVKCGPTMTSSDLKRLVLILNPDKIEGKLSIITRYGHACVADLLPDHIKAVHETGVPVVWICDPCHGNTELTEYGVKTRNYANMVREVIECFRIHNENDSRLGGVHLEMTGDDVTECIGGSTELTSEQLSRNYETFCDPRLNYTQSLDMAFTITKQLNLYRQ